MQLHIVDVFTDVPFKGNPAAVCLLEEPGDGWMRVKMLGDRVLLIGGQAITVLDGELR